jgi:hypothetical protein
MSQDTKPAISVVALRAEGLSLDGKNVVISLTTKYSTSERKYSVPVECLQDLIVDLKRLDAAASASSDDHPARPAWAVGI